MTAIPMPDRLYAYLPLRAAEALFRQEIEMQRPSRLGEAYDVLPELGELAISMPEVALLERYALELLESGKAETARQAEPAALSFTPAELASLRSFLGYAVAELMSTVDRAVHVLRLSEDANNPALWLSLADNHAGLMVEINPRHPGLFQPDPALDWAGRPLRVSYTAERPSFLRSLLPAPNSYGIAEMLTTRPQAFAQEREWRVLAVVERDPTAGADPLQATTSHRMALPAAAVTAVILGARTTASEMDAIRDYLRAAPAFAHVRLARAFVQPKEFGVFYRTII